MKYRCPSCEVMYGNVGEPAYVAAHCLACLRKGRTILCEPLPETIAEANQVREAEAAMKKTADPVERHMRRDWTKDWGDVRRKLS